MCDHTNEHSEAAVSCGSVDSKYMLLVMCWELNSGVLLSIESIAL